MGAQGISLKANGYQIKVFNLISPKESNKYNPFSYIRTETDVLKLITNLIKNTTPKRAAAMTRSGRTQKNFSYSLYFIMCGWRCRRAGKT